MPILTVTPLPSDKVFNQRLQQAIDTSSEPLKSQLEFLKTVSDLHKMDKYEFKLLFAVLTAEEPTRIPNVIYTRKDLKANLVKLREYEKDGISPVAGEGLDEVNRWYEKQLQFIPASILTKAKRLLEAAEYIMDQG